MGSASGKKGKNKQNITNKVAVRERECMELAVAGYNYQEIADKVGYKGPSKRASAYKAVQRVLKSEYLLSQEAASDYKQLVIARYDAILIVLYPRIGIEVVIEKYTKKTVTEESPEGTTIVTKEFESEFKDPNGDLQVIDRILKTEKQRSELLGLNQEKDDTIHVVGETIEEWLKRTSKDE